MELNDKLLDKISRYVRGQLPENEVSAFEKEINAKEELQKYVEMARFEMDAMEYLIGANLGEQISKWEDESPASANDEKKERNAFVKWWMGLVVVMVVLVGSLFFYFQRDNGELPKTTPTEQKLQKNELPVPIAKEEYITPEKIPDSENKNPKNIQKKHPNLPSAKLNNNDYLAYARTAYSIPDNLNNLKSNDNSHQINALTKAIQAFKDEDFKAAVKELESINLESSLYERSKEILAHAYFKNGQYEKAANLFQSIARESRFNKDEPEWYLLLSYIANYTVKKTKADALLEKISDDEWHNYQQNAIKIKEKLESLKH